MTALHQTTRMTFRRVTTIVETCRALRASTPKQIDRRGLLALLTASVFTAELSAAWPYQQDFGPFVIHGDFVPRGYGDMFNELVGLRDEISQTLKIHPCQEQIDVYLFSSKRVYQSYMRRYFPGVSPRRAMFIKSNSPGNVFAYASHDIAVDLRHETTHAFLHACLPMVPLWLDEGLAEYFEVPAKQRVRGNPYLNATRRELRWKRPTPLPELERLTSLQQMGADEYRESWNWVHFMLHGPPEAQDVLRQFFASVQRHEPPKPISTSLAAHFQSPERALAAHFQKWR